MQILRLRPSGWGKLQFAPSASHRTFVEQNRQFTFNPNSSRRTFRHWGRWLPGINTPQLIRLSTRRRPSGWGKLQFAPSASHRTFVEQNRQFTFNPNSSRRTFRHWGRWLPGINTPQLIRLSTRRRPYA